MEICLQGRKITHVQDYDRPPPEVLQLVCKLRWIGMEAEAEQIQLVLNEATRTGAVITAPCDTD